MSITDELREYALGWDERNRVRRDLRAIADRIDAEHEAALLNVHTDLMDASGWIRLPKDADGEYIHVGDEMCGYGWPNGGVYCRAIVNDVMILVGPQDGAYRGWLMWAANECRHHHAPTVEDVLREFAQEMNENLGMYTGEVIDSDEWRKADERTIAEYAAKLRLAEEADA